MDIASILEQAQPPQTSVTLCLRGPLVARYEQLDARLRDAVPAASLGDTGPAARLREEMAHLRETMLASSTAFTFGALTPLEFATLRTAMPDPPKPPPGGEVDPADRQTFEQAYHTWVCRLVAASCRDPAMTAEQADQLSTKLSDGQWRTLRDSAWAVNTDNQTVPFSAAASVLTRAFDAKSRRPEQSASPGPGSLAGSPPNEPSSTATTPDG